jgi:predicted P-loop ATPase
MQQLWAEVKEIYQSGERWHLSIEENKMLNDYNTQFEEIDAMEERLRNEFRWELDRRFQMSASEICKRMGIFQPNNSDCKKAGSALRKISGQQPNRTHGVLKFNVPPHKDDPPIMQGI